MEKTENKTFKDKVKTFLRDHKKEIVMVGLAAGSFAMWRFINRSGKHPTAIPDGLDCGVVPKKPYRGIDEDIFANLAPQIEDILLTEGLDEAVIDKTYAVPFPKFGDWKNGSYEVKKNVQVVIKDICG